MAVIIGSLTTTGDEPESLTSAATTRAYAKNNLTPAADAASPVAPAASLRAARSLVSTEGSIAAPVADSALLAPRLTNDARGSLPLRSPLALIILATVAVVGLLPLAKPFLLPVVIALLLAIVLSGPVRRLQRAGVSEPIGALIVVTCLVGLLLLAISALAQPASEWLARAPTNVSQLMTSFERLREAVPLLNLATSRSLNASGAEASPITETLASQGFNITRVVLAQVTGLALATVSTVILLYFLLAAEHWLVVRFIQSVKHRHTRLHWLAMGRAAQRDIAHYLGTMSLINVSLGVATGLALWVIGLPNPTLWGTVAGVLNFVPYLGPLVVSVLLFMAGVLQFETLGLMVAPAAAFLLINATEAYVVSPLAMGRRLDLNPVLVFISVMFWGWVWGVAGALVAVPILLAVRNLCRYSRRTRGLAGWLEQPAAPTKTLRQLVARSARVKQRAEHTKQASSTS